MYHFCFYMDVMNASWELFLLHSLSAEVMLLLKCLLIYQCVHLGETVARAKLFLRTKEYNYIILFILYCIFFAKVQLWVLCMV